MKRRLAIALGIIAASWCVYAVAGRPISAAAATRIGNALLRVGEGKIISAADFIHHRFFEIMWLATLLSIWACLHVLLARWRRSATSRRWNWISHSVLAFVCLNLCFNQAERTVLFWGLMWHGKETQNLTRFYIKLFLARENPAPVQAAIMGSSQARAQIDEELLNVLLGDQLRTTELHYPGSKAYDAYLLQPLVSRMHPHYIICYITEADFYSGAVSEVVPNFFTWTDVPDFVRRGGPPFIPRQRVGYGLLGDVVPLFRLREVLSQRLFGTPIMQTKQQRYDLTLESSLAERARSAAKGYEVNAGSQFQRQAFEDFLIRCQRANEHVVIFCGQMNPLFGAAAEPRLRQEMILFLRSLQDKYPNVTVEENLPRQTPDDYEDMTHVIKPAQERFTRFVAQWLSDFVARDASRRR